MLKELLNNSDIREIEKKVPTGKITSEELELLRLGRNCAETKVLSRIVNIVKALRQELSFLWGFGPQDIVVAQRENAAITKSQRIKRAREGSNAGMPDLDIILGDGKRTKTIFIETKRIGSDSELKKNSPHFLRQQECHDRLRRMGHSVYLTNNPVFVQKVVCEEIRRFFQ